MQNTSINKVCCVDSAYGLLLFFLITGNKIHDTVFFCSKHIPLIYRRKLGRNCIMVRRIDSSRKVCTYFVNALNYILVLFVYLKKGLGRYPAYGFDFLGWTAPIMSLSSEFFLIEDGVSNYTMPSVKLKQFEDSFWRRILTSNDKFFHRPFGLSNRVKRIYLTGILPIPKEIQKKVQLVDIELIWEKLDERTRSFIIAFFIGNIHLSTCNRKIIILTQCLSEDGWMSEEEKISVYSHLIKIYGINNIVLKTHPRELTNYKKLFPDAVVIDIPCPFQLLTLLGWQIEEAVTVNSTAVYSLPEEISKTLLTESGYLDKTMYHTVMHSIEQLQRERKH